jgi:ATP-binding cassette subfamily B (MDR/TAP) protein 1
MLNVSYASVVGSIMYIMVYTHLEISHVVSVVSKFMINPGKVHKHTVKWILCYLKGSTDIGMIYNKSSGTRSNVN